MHSHKPGLCTQGASIMHVARRPVVSLWKSIHLKCPSSTYWLGDSQEWNKHGHYELLGGSVAQGRKSEDITRSRFDQMNVDGAHKAVVSLAKHLAS